MIMMEMVFVIMIDNCFYVYNPNGQQDLDNDGEGDECDPDDGL